MSTIKSYEIDHMSNLHVDSSFHKQLMKIVNYVKIKELIDSSMGQSPVNQTLEEKRPKFLFLNFYFINNYPI